LCRGASGNNGNIGFLETIEGNGGQVQKLDRKSLEHYKAAGMDLTPILYQVDVQGDKFYNTQNNKPY